MVLEAENAYFDQHRDDLLAQHNGQFALIHQDELLGTFGSFEEAFAAGILQLGNQAFLIRQVTLDEPQAQIPALTLGLISAQP